VDASTDTGSINTNFPAVNVQPHQFLVQMLMAMSETLLKRLSD
jgi:hypothetical protein